MDRGGDGEEWKSRDNSEMGGGGRGEGRGVEEWGGATGRFLGGKWRKWDRGKGRGNRREEKDIEYLSKGGIGKGDMEKKE